jgi:imidazolonepropionase-like amidohydrolase
MASGGGLTPGTVPHEADLPLELMRLAAELAHAHGVQITAHCHATESITRALDAGLDMIEHVSFTEPPGRYCYDEEITRRIRDRGVVVSPTVEGALRTARRLRQSGKAHNPGDLAAVERLEGRLTNTAHFHRLGLKIIGGTDCGVTDTPFDTLVDEILCYTRAGLSNAEALRTVTSDSASFMNLQRLGEVKEGYRADLVLVTGDPLADLNALRHPLKVFLAGRVVPER